MNLSNVEFQLEEAVQALQQILYEIEAGTLAPQNEARLADTLGWALDKLSLAWNTRDAATHEVGHMRTVDVERLAKTVPNFGGDRQIGEVVW